MNKKQEPTYLELLAALRADYEDVQGQLAAEREGLAHLRQDYDKTVAEAAELRTAGMQLADDLVRMVHRRDKVWADYKRQLAATTEVERKLRAAETEEKYLRRMLSEALNSAKHWKAAYDIQLGCSDETVRTGQYRLLNAIEGAANRKATEDCKAAGLTPYPQGSRAYYTDPAAACAQQEDECEDCEREAYQAERDEGDVLEALVRRAEGK
jgi:hypothetical protein